MHRIAGRVVSGGDSCGLIRGSLIALSLYPAATFFDLSLELMVSYHGNFVSS